MSSGRAMLSESELTSLCEALDDEYKARVTYEQVIADFGDVRPFTNIVEAEARHIQALLGLFQTYGASAPPNRWLGKVEQFKSIPEACTASIHGEIANVAIYDRVMKTTERPDILAIYSALRSASLDRHLPAFQRCALRTGRRNMYGHIR